MRRQGWLALSGFAFVVLVLVCVVGIGGSTPGGGDSAAKITAFYDAHSTRQSVVSFLFAASAGLLAIFGARLAGVIGDAVEGDAWRRVLLLGTALTAALILVSALIHLALADAADHHVSGDGIRVLNFLDNDGWIAWNAGLGVMMLGAGAGLLAGRAALPRWLAWVALVAGVALFIPWADFIALLATLIWILIVSVLLARRAAAPAGTLVLET